MLWDYSCFCQEFRGKPGWDNIKKALNRAFFNFGYSNCKMNWPNIKKFIMKYKTTILLLAFITLILSSGFSLKDKEFQKNPPVISEIQKDSLKKIAIADSVKIAEAKKYKLHKKNAHASYYADRFTGRRTASGRIFDNKKYTAAHRKFPFGTKLRITNEANGKSVIVEVTDRGPFTKGKEIDLTRKAFMEIASSKYGGHLNVTIEIMQ